VTGVSLDGRKSYVGDPLGPLLESYSMVRSLSGRCETKGNNRPVRRKGPHRRVGSVSHRDPGAGVVLADCPGSASGRALRPCLHRLTPSSPQGGPSDNPLSHKRCLSFCELGELNAQEMEPRTTRAMVAHGREILIRINETYLMTV